MVGVSDADQEFWAQRVARLEAELDGLRWILRLRTAALDRVIDRNDRLWEALSDR